MEKYLTPYVFVYGTLKAGYGNDVLLTRNSATRLCSDTLTDNYVMVNYGCPMIYHATHPLIQETDELLPVCGEVWQVDEDNQEQTMKELDRLEGEGSLYLRKIRQTTGGWLVYTYEGNSRWSNQPNANTNNEGEYEW